MISEVYCDSIFDDKGVLRWSLKSDQKPNRRSWVYIRGCGWRNEGFVLFHDQHFQKRSRHTFEGSKLVIFWDHADICRPRCNFLAFVVHFSRSRFDFLISVTFLWSRRLFEIKVSIFKIFNSFFDYEIFLKVRSLFYQDQGDFQRSSN